MIRYWLDTNILVRFLTQDDEAQTQTANDLFQQAANGQCLLLLDPIVLVETVWVLRSVYYHAQHKVADGLLRLINKPGIQCEDLPIMQNALRHYQNTGLDIVDCVLAARTLSEGDKIATFDKGLHKLVNKHMQ